MAYIGVDPNRLVSLILYEYTATNGQTTFSGSDDNSATLSYTADNLQVVMNGVILDPSDYTASNGTSVVLASGAATNDLINIYAFKSFTTADMVSKTNGGTFAGAVTVPQLNADNIRLDGNTISSTDTNGDITLDPDGTGKVSIPADGAFETSDGPVLNFKSTDNTLVADDVVGSITFETADSSSAGVAAKVEALGENPSGGVGLNFYSGFGGSPVKRMTIDRAGNVGIGAASSNQTLHVQGNGLRLVNSSDTDALHLFAYDNNHATAFYYNASGTNTVAFHAADNSFFNPSNSDRGVLIGKTVSNTANVGHEFKKEGFFGATRDSGVPVQVRRNGNDGPLINFNQAGTIEGDISVSGSTVSYNGGHLSRWSQATDGNRIDGLVKGTVMTNLDQMAVWHHEAQAATYYTEDDELPDGVSVGDEKTPAVDAYDEQNEQLNCMAVSSVEGDANVAGVFVNWDDDDEDFTADMNIAMTGDMVIRIASGTTVARGDLLMSAGDGTAKPQDDDIVRSKTIAKVTSTTVSHTYDDGTFLVPCVLMAC